MVGCYLEAGGKILMLLTATTHEMLNGMEWTSPVVQRLDGEALAAAALRALRQHVGMTLGSEQVEGPVTLYWMDGPEDHQILHSFRARIGYETQVVLNETQHLTHLWIRPAAALVALPLKPGDCEFECIKAVYGL